MNRNDCRKWLAVAALAAGVAVASSADAGDPRPIEREIAVAEDAEISVGNLAGSVTVKTWDRAMLRIAGTLGEDIRELLVELDEDGEEVEIEVELPRNSRRRDHSDVAAELELTVPEGASVYIECVSASVEVNGVQGDVEVETVSGGIELSDTRSVDVESVSGRIDIRNFRGDIAASAVSGGVRAEGGEGALELSSVSGSLQVLGANLTGLEMETVSGSLRADFDPVGNGHFAFESVSGSIDLVLPSDLDATIEVEVFSGRIVTEYDGDYDEEEYGPGAWFQGSYGKGRAEILIDNHSGNVEIRKR